jgi:hypothetical protein
LVGNQDVIHSPLKGFGRMYSQQDGVVVIPHPKRTARIAYADKLLRKRPRVFVLSVQ